MSTQNPCGPTSPTTLRKALNQSQQHNISCARPSSHPPPQQNSPHRPPPNWRALAAPALPRAAPAAESSPARGRLGVYWGGILLPPPQSIALLLNPLTVSSSLAARPRPHPHGACCRLGPRYPTEYGALQQRVATQPVATMQSVVRDRDRDRDRERRRKTGIREHVWFCSSRLLLGLAT